jgi:hypothetical protein
VLSRAIGNIDYGSFKGGVTDKRRKWFYAQAWSIMADMQDGMQ